MTAPPAIPPWSPERFPGAILARRLRMGLTQAKAADLVGVASNTWARWERGEMTPAEIARRGVLGALEDAEKKKSK